jgi:hypothetical protein
MRDSFFLILAGFLLIVWTLSGLMLRAAGDLIHLLVLIAVLSLIVHFFRRSTA